MHSPRNASQRRLNGFESQKNQPETEIRFEYAEREERQMRRWRADRNSSRRDKAV